jgi:hypothetical protein
LRAGDEGNKEPSGVGIFWTKAQPQDGPTVFFENRREAVSAQVACRSIEQREAAFGRLAQYRVVQHHMGSLWSGNLAEKHGRASNLQRAQHHTPGVAIHAGGGAKLWRSSSLWPLVHLVRQHCST